MASTLFFVYIIFSNGRNICNVSTFKQITYSFIWIPEHKNQHHDIVRCPTDEEGKNDNNRNSQRFHFGFMYKSLSIRLTGGFVGVASQL